MENCSHCGGMLPDGATFCPSCGRRADAPVTREVPIDVQHAEPRYFGLAPPVFVFAAAVALLALGIGLILGGAVALGVIAIVLAACLLPTFLAGARRWPDTRLAQVGVSAADRVRDEAEVAADSISTLGRAGREVARLRKEQFQLRRERDAKVRELGVSVYEEDGRADELKAAAKELDERIEANEERLQQTVSGARRRVRRGRAAVVSTERIEPAENPLVEVDAAADEPPSDETEPEPKTERAPEAARKA